MNVEIQPASMADLKAMAKDGKLEGFFRVKNDDYHDGPGLSRSNLKDFRESPHFFRDKELNPKKYEKPKSEALIFGALVDALVFEPETLKREFVIAKEDFKANTKAGKAYRDDLQEKHPGKHIIKPAMKDLADECINSLKDHPMSAKWIEESYHQVSAYWYDKGVLCKARWDALHPTDGGVDYKTCRELKFFQRQCEEYGYYLQAAWYSRGLRALVGDKAPRGFHFVTVLKSFPWTTEVYPVSKDTLNYWDRVCESTLNRYRFCQETNTWPRSEHVMQKEL